MASGTRITATSYDTPAELDAKYGAQAARNIAICVQAGAAVMHGVDAAASLVPAAAGGPFQRVLFNFPHTGEQRVHANRTLLRGLFAACGCVAQQPALAQSMLVHCAAVALELLSWR